MGCDLVQEVEIESEHSAYRFPGGALWLDGKVVGHLSDGWIDSRIYYPWRDQVKWGGALDVALPASFVGTEGLWGLDIHGIGRLMVRGFVRALARNREIEIEQTGEPQWVPA